jgi:hypothetical protein
MMKVTSQLKDNPSKSSHQSFKHPPGHTRSQYHLVGGLNPSEKYEFVSWDYEIPNIWKVIKIMFQTTNQPSSLKIINHHYYL